MIDNNILNRSLIDPDQRFTCTAVANPRGSAYLTKNCNVNRAIEQMAHQLVTYSSPLKIKMIPVLTYLIWISVVVGTVRR